MTRKTRVEFGPRKPWQWNSRIVLEETVALRTVNSEQGADRRTSLGSPRGKLRRKRQGERERGRSSAQILGSKYGQRANDEAGGNRVAAGGALRRASGPPAPAGSSRGIGHDASLSAFDDLVSDSLGRVLDAAGKIGREVLDATRVMEEAFSVLKQLIAKSKHLQNPAVAGMAEFLRSLNNVIAKANSLTEGKQSEYFNHLKAVADGLTALAWIGYTGKDCGQLPGMRMPSAHVEESWQMAEFYSNKILVEYKNKEPEHINWAKSMKELYFPGLRDYVKNF